LQFEASEDETPLGRYESILLVEDDDAVRAVTQNILHSLGYEVHIEPGGAEALTLCSATTPPFRPVAHRHRHALHRRPRAGRAPQSPAPELKVLFMSGYVDDPVILQAVQDSHIPFLEKPFNRTTLAKKVREALENR